MTTYQVLVGNIGTVIETRNIVRAKKYFEEYVRLSLYGHGRAAGEDVYIVDDHEVIEEYQGSLQACND